MSALTDVPSVSSGREYEPGSSLVSVIVPIYNEQGNIPTLCMRLIQALKTAAPKFEIIAVNDGSRDGSVQELRRLRTAAS